MFYFWIVMLVFGLAIVVFTAIFGGTTLLWLTIFDYACGAIVILFSLKNIGHILSDL